MTTVRWDKERRNLDPCQRWGWARLGHTPALQRLSECCCWDDGQIMCQDICRINTLWLWCHVWAIGIYSIQRQPWDVLCALQLHIEEFPTCFCLSKYLLCILFLMRVMDACDGMFWRLWVRMFMWVWEIIGTKSHPKGPWNFARHQNEDGVCLTLIALSLVALSTEWSYVDDWVFKNEQKLVIE